LKDIYLWIKMEYNKEFPSLPNYKNFVKHTHRVLPLCIWALNELLDDTAPLRILETKFQKLVYLFGKGGFDLLQEVIRFVYNFIHRDFY